MRQNQGVRASCTCSGLSRANRRASGEWSSLVSVVDPGVPVCCRIRSIAAAVQLRMTRVSDTKPIRCVTRLQSLMFVPPRCKTTLLLQFPKYMVGRAITMGAISFPNNSSTHVVLLGTIQLLSLVHCSYLKAPRGTMKPSSRVKTLSRLGCLAVRQTARVYPRQGRAAVRRRDVRSEWSASDRRAHGICRVR